MSDPVTIHTGDVLAGLAQIPVGTVQCCVTSPPYWGLRDYGVDGQIGLEATPEAFVAKMVEVFAAVRRVLRDDGTLWLNIGDSYNAGTSSPQKPSASTSVGHWRDAGSIGNVRCNARGSGLKVKDLCMMPWRVALALQADGWYLRSVIVWHKRSPMPESVTDRPTSSWEPIFLLAKQERYYYDAEAVKEKSESTGGACIGPQNKPGLTKVDDGHALGGASMVQSRKYERPDYREIGRNQRNVWTLSAEPYSEAHFATFPSEIPRRAIMAGTSEKGCCPACRSPYARVVGRKQVKRDRPNDYTKRDGADGTGNSCANSVAGVETRTLGWEPTCSCKAGEPVPCLVLDPFLGSGTTIAVARQLGRHGVGCELNPEYVELARVRIGKAEKPHTFQDTREADAPLFGTLREVGT